MKRKYSKAIKKIAAQQGVSAEFIYSEMQKAIVMGYNNLDPEVQEYWHKIAPDNEIPAPDKYIEIIINQIKSAKK